MMNKGLKILSSFLAGIIVFNMTSLVHASEINSMNVNNSIGNMEQLAKQKLNEEEQSKIEKDYKYLTKCGLDVNEIYKIDVNENNENEYKFKYPNNAKETVIIKYNNGEYSLDIRDNKNKKHDKVVVDKDDVYLDGYKIELEESETVYEEGKVSVEDTIMPIDRDTYNCVKCPYGSASDYNNMVSTQKNSNVPLNKMIKDITNTALATIIGSVGIVAGISSTVASFIISQFPQSTSKGLSYKNFIYYHKNGHYISKIQGYVQKNNVRWYEKINYGGKSSVKATYTVNKIY